MNHTPAIVLLLFTTILVAQDPVDRDSITQLDEVILLDALKRKNAIGIVPSDIVGASVFQNSSPVSLVPSMNQIPGVYVFSGALNTNRITIRGVGARTLFGTDKLRLYYNDIPVTDGSGVSTIEAFDLENLSQIEVIKGPKGTTYGTNLGGAIILNPKEALGNATTISNNFTVGAFGLLKNNLSFNHYENGLRLGVQYGHTETDGYRQNSTFKRDGLLVNLGYRIDPKNRVNLLLNHIDYTAQIPSSLGATAFAEDPSQATFTWRASQGFEANKYTLTGLNYHHTFSEKLENSTSVFYTYLDHYEARPFGILDEFTNGYGIRSRFLGKTGILDTPANYVLGTEGYRDVYVWDEFQNNFEDNNGNGSLQGAKFADNKEYRTQLNLFGSLEVPFSETFTAQMGVNLNKTKYNYRDFFGQGTENRSATRNFKAILLPSLNLNYRLSNSKSVYFNVSRGFSNPTLEQSLTPDGAVNPDIAQETGMNYELGTQLFLDRKRLRLQLAVYQMNIQNLLVGERIDNDRFIGRNAGKTRHRGLELAVKYRLPLADGFQLSPFVNYTLTDHSFIDFVDEEEDFSGNPLTGVPKHRATAGLQLQLFSFCYWNVTYQHVGAIPLTDANSLSSDSFNVLNTRLGFYKKLSDRFSLGMDLGINNLFDIVYAQSVLINTNGFGGNESRYFYPGDARNAYGSLRLGYRF